MIAFPIHEIYADARSGIEQWATHSWQA